MYYDFRVPIPDAKGKIYPQERNGVTYIQYEYARVYNPDKKYNTPKRTTIGKVCEDDSSQMYPNPNYLKYFPEAELPGRLPCRQPRHRKSRFMSYSTR